LQGVHLDAVQRARVISALSAVCAEHGAQNLTVARVVAQAGISRRTFYELFKDCEDCFMAAFEDAFRRASRRVVPMYRGEGSWRERVRASLEALLAFFDSQPDTGRLMVVETLRAGASAAERRERVIAHLVEAIDEARTEANDALAPPALTAEGTVGAVLSVVHNRMLVDRSASLLALVNPLMGMIVLPYLGPDAAGEELEKPVARRAPTPVASCDPLAALGTRLTYRTARVLLAISEHPGGSNREIGGIAGVRDQGQISKLLGRLKRLELVENTCELRAKGMPNSWELTPRGNDVRKVLSAGAGAAPTRAFPGRE
jgi:AcrR family transcriptional regulator